MLDTLSNLREAIRRQSHRNDLDNAQIDDFITQCETDIYFNEVDILRVREMDTRSTATLSTASRFIALPDNFLEMRRLKLNLSSGLNPDVRFRAPDQMVIKVSGMPRYFTVTSQLELDRVADTAYEVEMQYYMRAEPLTDAADVNFVLANYPNIYLFGSLWALFQWSMDEQRADYYRNKFISAIRGANKGTKKGAYGPAPFMRIEGSTP